MEFLTIDDCNIIYWTGTISETKLRLDSTRGEKQCDPVLFHSAMVFNKPRNRIYCCASADNYQVSSTYTYSRMQITLIPAI